jgi:hypothetical protein
MNNLRIDEIQGGRQRQVTHQVQQVRQRVELHRSSEYQAERATFAGIGKQDLSAVVRGDDNRVQVSREPEPIVHRLRTGERIEIWRMTREQAENAEAVLAAAGKGRDTLEAAALHTGATYWNDVAALPPDAELTEGSQALIASANQTYEVWMTSTGQDQRDAQAEGMLLAGMWGAEQSLHLYFQETVTREAKANDVRAQLRELQTMLEGWPDDGSTELFSWTEVRQTEDGSLETIEHVNEPLTKEGAVQLASQLEGQEQTLSGIVNKDMMKLQYMMHKNQQAMETLSNILKAQNDTRNGIIGNVKA